MIPYYAADVSDSDRHTGSAVGIYNVGLLFGVSFGSSLYLLQDESNFQMFKLQKNEFTFSVDTSQLPCGLNGALYFVEMDQDGGTKRFPDNKAGAKYGTGYCDVQCPTNLKFINCIAHVDGWQHRTTIRTDSMVVMVHASQKWIFGNRIHKQ
jgi:cellulose 1,4-beta-cellobiosidase